MPRKKASWPVILYPEGIIVGRVRSGKNAAGKVRHIGFYGDKRVGTFDTMREATEAVLEVAVLEAGLRGLRGEE